MDPRRRADAGRRGRLPRTRGDGPRHFAPPPRCSRASPHTRGWTPPPQVRPQTRHGFPAHAGMDPAAASGPTTPRRLPRTRGDGPSCTSPSAHPVRASPHTRGWTPRRRGGGKEGDGFPAHAGMDPRRRARSPTRRWLPRTRGDGPRAGSRPTTSRTASPHTRGWTPVLEADRPPVAGFPAHAGMDRATTTTTAPATRLPRTRGDGPGLVPELASALGASPHTRGWTVAQGVADTGDPGFPAHAGMDPGHQGKRVGQDGLPRTRGDGPGRGRPCRSLRRASPHTRGWTRVPRLDPLAFLGFPAHAGMDPPPAPQVFG